MSHGRDRLDLNMARTSTRDTAAEPGSAAANHPSHDICKLVLYIKVYNIVKYEKYGEIW